MRSGGSHGSGVRIGRTAFIFGVLAAECVTGLKTLAIYTRNK